ncbi:MAG: tetratricopeptide repeat protein [Mogibacterium sp.]|nr:tetratricopeptide repeat protein [Mogibacterium sp.]
MSMNNRGRDRISEYLIDSNRRVLFDELSERYLRSVGAEDLLSGVPVPVAAGLGEELSNATVALGMARVIGADNSFPYKAQYMEFMRRTFGENVVRAIVAEGAKLGGSGDYEVAAMMFRAALLFDPKSQDALYLYGRACKDAYEIETQDEAYVGNFKAESIEAFELLTMLHPDFAMGYYFLGYGYANLGLYAKAELTWKDFMRLTEDGAGEADDLRDEIAGRLKSLEDPVRIEQACNMILGGDYLTGRNTLMEYADTDFANWWPLWYHIGTAEAALGNAAAAIAAYRRALALTPSNTALMQELVEIYDAVGDAENAAKYRRKIEIIANNIENERRGN